jgi:MFS family permease
VRGARPSRIARALSSNWPDKGPTRILTLNALVNSTGTGAYMAAAALFYTRYGGISVVEYALGLSVAGIIGVITAVPIGRLADRYGARPLLLGVTLWRAAGYAALAYVHGFPAYLLTLCLLYIFDRNAAPLNQTLVSQLMKGKDRTRTMAFVRSVRNIGFSLGFAVAGVAIGLGTANAYRSVFFLNSATFIFAFLAIRRLPRVAPVEKKTETEAPAGAAESGTQAPMRDVPFVGVTFSNTILFLHDAILLSALPIWVADYTRAPAWTITILLLVNTIMAVTAQVGVTARVTDLRTASTATSQSSLYLMAACVALAASGLWRNPYGSAAVLIVAIVLLSMGELLHSAGAWQMSFDLSPESQQGRYIAFFNAGFSASEILGPFLVLWLITHDRSLGWLPLAAIFPLAALTSRAFARRSPSFAPATESTVAERT